MKKFEELSIQEMKKIYKKYTKLKKNTSTLKPKKIKKERN